MPERLIDAVTFDFWNTLMYEERGHLRGRRVSAWLGILEEAAIPVERQRLEAALDQSWNAYVEAWVANRQYDALAAATEIIAGLGLDVPDAVREALLAAFREAGNEAELHLAANIEPTLRQLRAAGVAIGIVCDVGMTPSATLRAHLQRSGVLALFDHCSFSDEVGVYKPDRRIFDHALEGLGTIAPERAAHVGDLRRTDIAGAAAIGMLTVRYTGVFDDPGADGEPEAAHVVADHAALPATLGLTAS